MILAAADYAEGKAGPSPDMVVALRTQRWGLPYQGGWIEQPAGTIERIQAMLNVYEAVRSWRRSKNWGRFAQTRPDSFRIVQQVIKLRAKRGR